MGTALWVSCSRDTDATASASAHFVKLHRVGDPAAAADATAGKACTAVEVHYGADGQLRKLPQGIAAKELDEPGGTRYEMVACYGPKGAHQLVVVVLTRCASCCYRTACVTLSGAPASTCVNPPPHSTTCAPHCVQAGAIPGRYVRTHPRAAAGSRKQRPRGHHLHLGRPHAVSLCAPGLQGLGKVCG
jgi:hypothetical protein